MAPRHFLLALCLAVFLPTALAQLQLFTPNGCRLYGGQCQRDIDCRDDGLFRSNFGPALCRSRVFNSFNGYCCSSTRDLCRAYRGQCLAQCGDGQVAETRYHALCRNPALACCFPNRLASSQNTAVPITAAPTPATTTTSTTTTTTTTTTTPTTTAPTTTAPTTTAPTTTAPTTVPAFEEVTRPPPPGTSRRNCGLSTVTRFSGGFLPSAGEWPWMATVHLGPPNDDGSSATCAAVLINQNTLLTYDDCVPPANAANDYYVTLGDRDASTLTSETDQVMQVARVIRANDSTFDLGYTKLLAMVKLRRSITPGPLVSPVCLSRPGVQLRSGSRCYTAGYGTGEGGPAGTLRAASVRLLSRQQCQGSWDVLTGQTLGADLLCTAAPRFDDAGADCPQSAGDLGGMLVCEDTQNLWTLVGITAPKKPCDQSMPNIYVNVTAYSQWINARL